MLKSMSISKLFLRDFKPCNSCLTGLSMNQLTSGCGCCLQTSPMCTAPKVQRPPKSPKSTNAAWFKVAGQILAQVQPSTNRAKLDCRPRFLDKMWDWNTKSFINELGVPSFLTNLPKPGSLMHFPALGVHKAMTCLTPKEPMFSRPGWGRCTTKLQTLSHLGGGRIGRLGSPRCADGMLVASQCYWLLWPVITLQYHLISFNIMNHNIS
jgi:hypothetical protein